MSRATTDPPMGWQQSGTWSYQCGICHAWVPLSQVHLHQTPPDPHISDVARVAAALERIAAALERAGEGK